MLINLTSPTARKISIFINIYKTDCHSQVCHEGSKARCEVQNGERKGLDWDGGEYHAAVTTLRVEATDIFPDIWPFRTPAHQAVAGPQGKFDHFASLCFCQKLRTWKDPDPGRGDCIPGDPGAVSWVRKRRQLRSRFLRPCLRMSGQSVPSSQQAGQPFQLPNTTCLTDWT